MHFKIVVASFTFLATLFASAQAATVVAYGGSDCTGSVGNTVPCDGSCRAFGGRHSLKISGGGTHCVTLYENSGCTSSAKVSFAKVASGTCFRVNTGGPVVSFRCSDSTSCVT
ncbi:hypothetical protein JR316_0003978 [Psilocybe cubensis]|uniref:Uncharacterized protein n=1 Tax=Psilocybe cubensis TaxID=181762 RepID=A0ACB8HAI9_PSICU|nr:hypothetical protein JR316_0003978 [Psilocybe cubensis]KAH9484496.1 hypothetical protein JR316_0003978 [Psilocybe cubensis]